MSTIAIGIDLGTSTSEIAIYKEGEPFPIPDPATKSPIVPSLVAMNKKGNIKVGEDARTWVDRPGHGCREFKRDMGKGIELKLMGQSLKPEELSAHVLKKLKWNAEQAMGITISDVVISVPANFNDPARAATKTAGELAGMRVTRLINEPTAAAMAFGIKHLDAEECVVVFDFGGGTLDVAVLEMVSGILDVKSSYGDPMLGGKDFDEIVQKLLMEKFTKENPSAVTTDKTREGLKGHAEKAKKALSANLSFEDPLPSFAMLGNDPIDLEVEITRHEFDTAISPLLDRARSCLSEALKRSGVEKSQVGSVLLVGGTTYIPAVRQLVAEHFDKEPDTDIQPDLAVCLGASIQSALANHLIPEDKGLILTDVSPFGLGVDVLHLVGGQPMLVYDPLMMPNTTIPYSVRRDYSLIHEEQNAVTIRLYQDHNGTAKLPGDAHETGLVARITDIPPSSTGEPHPLEVEFSYDINGMAKVKASIKETQQEIEITFSGSELRMDEKDLSEARNRVAALWEKNEKASEYKSIIEKGEKIARETEDSRKDLLIGSIGDLKKALAGSKADQIELAGDRLVDLISDIESDSI